MKLSTDANPGDAPQLMNALVQFPVRLPTAATKFMPSYTTPVAPTPRSATCARTTHQRVWVSTPGSYAGNLQAGGSLCLLHRRTDLIRQEPGVDSGVTIASGVTGYYPEGVRFSARHLLFLYG